MVTGQLLGISRATHPSYFCGAHVPSNESTKCMIIKVQLPLNWDDGALFVYTKKRSFVCSVQKQDSPSAYDRIVKVVKTQGVGGVKAYFAVELRSKDELVKVSEVLASRPF